jgi:hypothetical protein
MADPISDFFDGLRRRGREPMLASVAATVRFDVIDGGRTDSWRLAVSHGELDVSSGAGAVDCAIAAERTLLEGVVTGTVNAMAALLRGELAVSGDPELVVAVQRLFPGPSRSLTPDLSSAQGGQRP